VTGPLAASGATNGFKLDATDMVKGWLTTPSTNHGFLLKETSETSNTQKSRWHTSESDTSSAIPKLEIAYTETTTAPPTSPPPGGATCTCIPGDVNGDGVVTILDASLILRYLAGLADLVTPVYNKGDIAVINNMITTNGWHGLVEKAPADGSSIPASWSQIYTLSGGQWARLTSWTDNAVDKRLISLNVSVELTSKAGLPKLYGTLDLRGLTKLVSLNCSGNTFTGNGLAKLNVTGLYSLKEIFAQDNRLTEIIGLSGLTGLIGLDCSYNDFTSLAFCPTANYLFLDVRMCRFPSVFNITGFYYGDWDTETYYFTPQR